jgi:hypothetical protein
MSWKENNRHVEVAPMDRKQIDASYDKLATIQKNGDLSDPLGYVTRLMITVVCDRDERAQSQADQQQPAAIGALALVKLLRHPTVGIAYDHGTSIGKESDIAENESLALKMKPILADTLKRNRIDLCNKPWPNEFLYVQGIYEQHAICDAGISNHLKAILLGSYAMRNTALAIMAHADNYKERILTAKQGELWSLLWEAYTTSKDQRQSLARYAGFYETIWDELQKLGKTTFSDQWYAASNVIQRLVFRPKNQKKNMIDSPKERLLATLPLLDQRDAQGADACLRDLERRDAVRHSKERYGKIVITPARAQEYCDDMHMTADKIQERAKGFVGCMIGIVKPDTRAKRPGIMHVTELIEEAGEFYLLGDMYDFNSNHQRVKFRSQINMPIKIAITLIDNNRAAILERDAPEHSSLEYIEKRQHELIDLFDGLRRDTTEQGEDS